MHMMRFSYSISHIPGKPSTRSTPIVKPLNQQEEKLESDAKAYVDSVIRYLPATEDRLEELRCQQQEDEVTKQIKEHSSTEWPEKSRLAGALKPYWPERNELIVLQWLLMKRNRLVIPVSTWLDVLDTIQEVYQGIVKCRESKNLSMVARSEQTT